MSYYLQGDYYAGAGDPGIGALVKRVGSALVKRVAPRLPIIGPIATGIGIAGSLIKRLPALPGFETRPKAFMPGGERLFAQTMCPSGSHLGGKFKDHCVRNRSMNPANPRALRRAIRREQAFVVLARRVLKGTGITIGRRTFGKKTARKR